MLKRLHLKNFTVFADADFEFGPGLNVLVGTNGTGKSHVLKVGYAVEVARFDISKDLIRERLHELGTNPMAWTNEVVGCNRRELGAKFPTSWKKLLLQNGRAMMPPSAPKPCA